MNDAWLMRQALDEARAALVEDEVPVGCVVAHLPSGEIVGSGRNRRHNDNDPTAHAEIIAIRQAARHFGRWRLFDCVLAVTLEPCPMCAGAMVNARIGRLVYGCADPKAGAARTLYRLCDDDRLNHRMEITDAVEADACAELLRTFFQAQRALGKK